jgi:hypothetical protein
MYCFLSPPFLIFWKGVFFSFRIFVFQTNKVQIPSPRKLAYSTNLSQPLFNKRGAGTNKEPCVYIKADKNFAHIYAHRLLLQHLHFFSISSIFLSLWQDFFFDLWDDRNLLCFYNRLRDGICMYIFDKQ